jgi:hypothetical protein
MRVQAGPNQAFSVWVEAPAASYGPGYGTPFITAIWRQIRWSVG